MEHRYGIRLEKEFNAQVCFDGGMCGDAVTLDISKHGLCLALHHPKLVSNAIVQVVLRTEVGSMWSTRAMVVHTSNRGAGLLLEKDIPALFHPMDARKAGHLKVVV